MQPRIARRLRRIKAFADDAGVSVRTLHVYDRLGLLKPAEFSQSGYRLYGEPEFERLEHILALRFIGFSLDQRGIHHAKRLGLDAKVLLRRSTA